MDAQVGRLLDELDHLSLRENTIIVLWGDHGWHLGEQHMWGKNTNYENATRAPLIVSVPGAKTAGQKSAALVELVDLYPSLCDFARLPLPAHLEGASFAPLLDDPASPLKNRRLQPAYPSRPHGLHHAHRSPSPHPLADHR